MQRYKKYIWGFVACLLVLQAAIFAPVRADATVFYQDEETRSLYVDVLGQRDLFDADTVDTGQARQEIEDMLLFASEQGFDSVMVSAGTLAQAMYVSDYVPMAPNLHLDGFDPLAFLLQRAQELGLKVGCVLDVSWGFRSTEYSTEDFSAFSPASKYSFATYAMGTDVYFDIGKPAVQALAVQVLQEFAQKYDVDMVMLQNAYYPDVVVADDVTFQNSGYSEYSLFHQEKALAFLSACVQALRQTCDADIGVMVPDDASAMQQIHGIGLTQILQLEVDCIAPVMQTPLQTSGVDYTDRLEYLTMMCQDQVRLMPVLLSDLVEDGTFYNDYEMNFQILYNRTQDVNAFALRGYKSLKNSENGRMQALEALFEDRQIRTQVDLEVLEELAFGRPSGSATTYDSTFFVTGTSDPSLPLYVDGQLVDNRGEHGEFGVLVELDIGKNTIVARQGSVTDSVTITRYDTDTDPTPIQVITKNSMYPLYDVLETDKTEIVVSCTAPAGARVWVEIDGNDYELFQVADAQAGIPAKFQETIVLDTGVAEDEVIDLGQLTYTLSYNGAQSEYTSAGRLYVQGENAYPKFKVTYPFSNVYETAAESKSVQTYLPLHATGYIKGTEGNFFLTSAGYISRGQVEVLTGKMPELSYDVTGIVSKRDGREEQITIKGFTEPVFAATMQDNVVKITFYDATLAADMLLSLNSMVSSLQIDHASGNTYVTITPKEGVTLWGYDVEYRHDDTVITLKQAPTLSDVEGKPLSGISVMVDAGHGGDDPGALGAAGTNGPMEAALNLAIAQQLKAQLEDLGATVYMVRENDQWVTLIDRLGFSTALKPDFFVAVHQNALAYQTDNSKIDGLEVYYFDENSGQYAQNIANAMEETTGRNNKGEIYSYFYVTKTSFCRSVLVENGYIPNAQEYSLIVQPEQIEASAQGILQGIVQTIEDFTS